MPVAVRGYQFCRANAIEDQTLETVKGHCKSDGVFIKGVCGREFENEKRKLSRLSSLREEKEMRVPFA